MAHAGDRAQRMAQTVACAVWHAQNPHAGQPGPLQAFQPGLQVIRVCLHARHGA